MYVSVLMYFLSGKNIDNSVAKDVSLLKWDKYLNSWLPFGMNLSEGNFYWVRELPKWMVLDTWRDSKKGGGVNLFVSGIFNFYSIVISWHMFRQSTSAPKKSTYFNIQ